jgi:hypothetical protein
MTPGNVDFPAKLAMPAAGIVCQNEILTKRPHFYQSGIAPV